MNTFSAIIMLHNINDRVQHWVDKAQKSEPSMSEEDQYVMWKTMYDMVFSDNISGRAFEMIQDAGLSMDYYDPDTSYQEDVEAFARALKWLCDDNPLFVPEPTARSLSF